MALNMSPVLPEKVTVYYPGRRCSGSVSSTVPLWYKNSFKLSDTLFTDNDVPSYGEKGVENATLIIHDACQALFSSGIEDPTNKTALADLTSQIAQDFYDFRSFNMDMVYVGICSVEPTALYDYIEFIYDADQPDEDDNRTESIENLIRPPFSTRIFTEPWNGEVMEMQHMDPDIADCTDENNDDNPISPVPCVYYYEGHGGGCTGGGARGYANIDEDGHITSIEITNGGEYTGTPTVVISGDGTGAKATATVGDNEGSQEVTEVAVDEGGEDYTYAVVSFKGGGGKLQLVRRKLCLEDGRLVSTFISYDTIG